MAVSLQIQHSGFSDSEVSETVHSALRNEAEHALLRRDYYRGRCQAFEAQYGMSSNEFMEKFEPGLLGDESQWCEWYAVQRGYILWERRYRILNGVTMCMPVTISRTCITSLGA